MKPARTRPVGIVVLGMHRSGTSLLTRVLNLLGCALPKNLLGAHESNPRGHWESLDAIEINDTLLSALGRRWDDVRELPDDWLDRGETEYARQRIRSLLEREFSSQPMWVLKEPRLCRLAPLWLEAIAALDMDARVIVPVRHPLEVSHSLATRNDLDAGRSHLLWWQHLVEAERGSRDVPRTLLHFHNLVTDWKSECERMAVELGVKWPVRLAAASERIERFIDPKLRHADALAHAYGETSQPLPLLVASLYESTLELRGGSIWEAIASADANLEAVRSLYAPAIEGMALAVEKADRHASAVDAMLSSNLVDRQNLVLGTDEVRLLREQSYGILDKIEKNGPLTVELVKQIEAQRLELAVLTKQTLSEIASLADDQRDLVAGVEAGQRDVGALIGTSIGTTIDELSRMHRETVQDLTAQSLTAITRVADAVELVGSSQNTWLAAISGQQDNVATMLTGLVDDARAQRETMARLNQQLKDDALEYSTRINWATQRLDETALQLRESVRRHHELEIQHAALKAGLDAKVHELGAANAMLVKTEASLAETALLRESDHKVHLADLQSLASSVALNHELASRLSSLESEMAESMRELDLANAKLVDMERVLAETELLRQIDHDRHNTDMESLASSERESASLRRAIALNTETVGRLEDLLGQARVAAQKLQSRIDSSLAERDDIQQRLDVLVSQALRQEQAGKALAERLVTHEQALAAIERSRSWRLTAPLRVLVRGLRGS